MSEVMIPFENTFAALPDRFYTKMSPTPVARPELLLWNEDLAGDLGLGTLSLDDKALIFSGNTVPDGADALAQVYAGHQFGGWSPQLGDGRAILLGEVRGRDGALRDIQLKGSGPTPYSRMGDGRAWLGPVLREYVVSEAMAALGVPTTRALAAVATGETVLREARLPGAVLTRVASSHLRVGTFQYFAARGDVEALELLTQFALERHAPKAEGPAELLSAVVAAQARLVAQWMGLGFIHGVMNTDNCTISGETIDFGPCAFMDTYRAGQVFSSIDQFGRYAFANQPNMAAWNLAQLATALLPLMPDRDAAIEDFTARVNAFADQYAAAWREVFGAKLGLPPGEASADLAMALLKMMEASGADFTRSFHGLKTGHPGFDHADLDDWLGAWRAAGPETDRLERANPAIIPRNHRIEAMIEAALGGDLSPAKDLLSALRAPFEEPADQSLMDAPTPEEIVPATFCGT